MKRLLLPLLAAITLPTAVNAVDYVQCEAIRSVIARNSLQLKEATSKARDKFPDYLVRKKLADNGFSDCDDADYGFCNRFRVLAFSFKEDWQNYLNKDLAKYLEVEKRAQKDFDKKGCYWY